MEPQNDHDLLITMAADVKGLKLDIADLKDNFKGRMDDQENRLRSLEMARWLMWGAIAIIGFIITTLSNAWSNIHF